MTSARDSLTQSIADLAKANEEMQQQVDDVYLQMRLVSGKISYVLF